MTFAEKYPGETLRALSWKQPFASLMLHGKVETRVWDSKYRGWVLICASKSMYNDREVREIAGDTQYDRIEKMLIPLKETHIKLTGISLFPTGQAIAIGKLTHSTSLSFFNKGKDIIKEIEKNTFVKFNPALFGHTYTEVQPIVPFEWSGVQGWKTVDEETKSKIILL